MKTQEDMRRWLVADSRRSIKTLFHLSGWRIDLCYSYTLISTGMAPTIEEAFGNALSGFESGICRVLRRELEEAKEAREREIGRANERVGRIEMALQAATARLAKSAA